MAIVGPKIWPAHNFNGRAFIIYWFAVTAQLVLNEIEGWN